MAVQGCGGNVVGGGVCGSLVQPYLPRDGGCKEDRLLKDLELGVLTFACNPSTQKAESRE